MRLAELALMAALGACGRTQAEDVRAEDIPLPQMSGGEAAAVAPPEVTPARLTRAGLDDTVRAGLGAFLATVEVSPTFARGRFVGWRLDAARDLPRWNRAGMALQRGDVVTAVNGGSLERPDDALAVFNALRGAAELRVDVVRAGQPLTLRLAVE